MVSIAPKPATDAPAAEKAGTKTPSIISKLVSAVNPRFNDYQRARLLAFLVAITTAGGFGYFLWSNFENVVTVRTETGWANNRGDWHVQKAYINSLHTPPPGLDGKIERKVDMCILWASIDRPRLHASSGTYMLETRTCMYPPNEVLAAMGFPSFLRWCAAGEVQPLFRANFQTGLGDPFTVFNADLERNSPGWKCVYNDMPLPGVAGFANYPMCGWTTAALEAPPGSPNAIVWNDYNAVPIGEPRAPFTLGLQYTITDKETTKPNPTTALGAALGWVGLIELLATLLFGMSLVGTGVAKPKPGKKASVINLLKGAGIEALEEELKEIAGAASGEVVKGVSA